MAQAIAAAGHVNQSTIDLAGSMTQRNWITATLLCLACAAGVLGADTMESDLDMMAKGYKSGDKALLNKGLQGLERKATAGNADAAYNLGVYYSGLLTPDTRDEAKECKWTLMAARRNHVDAYSGAIVCGLRKAQGSQLVEVVQREVLPWVRKQAAESRDPESAATASAFLRDWDAAMAAKTPSTLGDLVKRLSPRR